MNSATQREPGKDGVTGLLAGDRAMRAREVSRPGPAEEAAALAVVDSLLARLEGRRRR
ncbi:hypothetical protein ACQCX2_01095 [Propionibacteriaceae bacterium Y1700]|uniref:hypothetical protein n=1 Tax=Microlunatus sp. Y1700 TaxID=3418487 RepID=UPI003DA6E51B